MITSQPQSRCLVAPSSAYYLATVGDAETAAKIVTVAHPQEAKGLGRTIAGFDEDTWVAPPLDQIWGVGLSVSDPRIHDPEQWLGLNLLGEALMAAREKLRGE